MSTVNIPFRYPVVSNPKILSGKPVISGTRISVSLLMELLRKGYSPEIILNEYPSLTKEKLGAFFSLMSKSFDVNEASV